MRSSVEIGWSSLGVEGGEESWPTVAWLELDEAREEDKEKENGGRKREGGYLEVEERGMEKVRWREVEERR